MAAMVGNKHIAAILVNSPWVSPVIKIICIATVPKV